MSKKSRIDFSKVGEWFLFPEQNYTTETQETNVTVCDYKFVDYDYYDEFVSSCYTSGGRFNYEKFDRERDSWY